jgi:glutamate--cysteine ligase
VCDDRDQELQAANLEAVVNRGRQPGLQLQSGHESQPIADWAEQLCAAMEPIARALDNAHSGSHYLTDLRAQHNKVEDPELTPSARILREMREQDLPFFRLAMGYSERWADYYRERSLPGELQHQFEQAATRSIEQQQQVEAADAASFEQYLDSFFSQYRAL